MNAVDFTADQWATIATATCAIPEASWSSLWSIDDTADVRSAAKKHYVSEQSHRCCYCKQRFVVDHGLTWAVEHVLCRAIYPKFTFEPLNLAVSCHDCNGAKREADVYCGKSNPPVKYPNSSKSFSIPHPHFDEYQDHISISDTAIYIPISDKGANLIKICKLWRLSSASLSLDVDPTGVTFDKVVDRCASATSTAEKRMVILEIGMIINNALKNL